MSDDQELDRQLRMMAHTSLTARASAVDVDAERHALSARLTGETPGGRSDNRQALRAAGHRQWLMVAAVAALLAGGIVTIGWLRSADDATPIRPADTTANTFTTDCDPGPSECAPNTATTIVVPATTDPATSEPAISGSNTTAPELAPVPTFTPIDTTGSVADPVEVRAGGVVTVTPPGPIERSCGDRVSMVAGGDDSISGIDGQISQGIWLPAPDGLSAVDLLACDVPVSAAPVTLVVPADVPPGSYDICLTRYEDSTGCAYVQITAAAEKLPEVSTVSDAARAALDGGYFTRRSNDAAPYYDIVNIIPKREETTLDESRLSVVFAPLVLLDGWMVSLGGEDISSRCDNRTVEVSGEGAAVDIMARELPVARSIATNSLGTLWAGRDVCPPGSKWGDPGTFFELVALDLTAENPAVTVIQTRPSDPNAVWFDDGEVVYAPGDLTLWSISSLGRFAAVEETVLTEKSRWHVFDLSAPGAPVTLASGCPLAGDIIGAPSFVWAVDVESPVVVVPRLCASLIVGDMPASQMPGDGDVQVEAVGLAGSSTPNDVVWRTSVAGTTADGYSRSAHVSARFDDNGTIVALLTAAGGVELQSRTFVLIGTDATEITTPRSERSAFVPRELFSPWELATTAPG